MLHVAVIGTGKMGQVHMKEWQSVQDARVVGIWGRNKERTENIAQSYGVDAYDDFDALLEREDIHVIDVCMPTFLHKEYVNRAAKAGKHVICEKPLALTTADAQEMIDVCAQNQVHLFVGHVLRFTPEYAQARAHVKAGKIGRAGVCRLSRLNSFPKNHGWYGDPQKSGGLVMDLLIHDFDWLRWAFGDVHRVTTVSAESSDTQQQVVYAQVLLRMKDGTIAHVEGSWAHPEFHASFELSGDKGMLVHRDKDTMPIHLHMNHDHSDGEEGDVKLPRTIQLHSPIQRQLAHFTDCILHDASPVIEATDALKAIQIAEATHVSAQTGKPVTL